MVFSTFTMLGNHPLYLVPELFFTPERNSDLIKSLLPVYLFSQLLETTALLSPSRDSAYSGRFIEIEFYSTWFLRLASFVQHRVFSVPSGLDRAQNFLFKPGYSSIGWVDHILCLYSSADGRLSCFYLLMMVSEAAMSMCRSICSSPCIQFFWVHTCKWTYWVMGDSLCNCWKKPHYFLALLCWAKPIQVTS